MISHRSRKMTGKARLTVRKSSLCLVIFGTALLMLGAMFFHATYQRQADTPLIGRVAGVVKTLALTDLCLFTEARYTRHPSQADLFSAFQDHPMALEHFPAGSIVGPPATLRKLHDKLD